MLMARFDWIAIVVIGVLLWLSSAGIGTHPFYRGALMIGTLLLCACVARDRKTAK
jgi:hypothetical protein